MADCSPRVRNLQTEMDLLRSEIQKLKAIDIRSCSGAAPRQNRAPRSDQSANSDSLRSMDRRRRNTKIVQMGLASFKDLSESDESENADSGSVDLGELVEEMRSQKTKKYLQSSVQPAVAGALDVDSDGSVERWETTKPDMMSRGTDPVALECTDCSAAEQEKLQLLSQLHQLDEALQQQLHLAEAAQKKAEGHALVLHQLRENQRVIRHSGVMTDAAVGSDNRATELLDQSTQCNLGADDLARMDEALGQKDEEIRQLSAANAALLSEDVNLQSGRRQQLPNCEEQYTGAILELNGQEQITDDRRSQLQALLYDAGVSPSRIPSLTATIDAVFRVQIDAVFRKEDSNDQGDRSARQPQPLLDVAAIQVQGELHRIRQEMEQEIRNHCEEKELLSHKIVELRKLLKKETTEKEAAQKEARKLQNDMTTHYSEMQQSQSLVQEKRQQVDDLEDSLAILQHENEKWERDFEHLLRTNAHLEREVRLARNLEHSQTNN